MKNKKKRIVGLALDKSDDQAIGGVLKWAGREGWEMIDLRAWHWQDPGPGTIDGLIYGVDFKGRPKLKRIVSETPCKVRMEARKSNTIHGGVNTDWEAVGQQAADYYLGRGFRNFALAAYQTKGWDTSLRVFKEQIEQAGGECTAIKGMHLANKKLETVHKKVRKQLRDLSYPLGIFCANDRLAVRLCHWCLEEGIAVPEQAAILGFDNDPIACCSNSVPLSSIDRHLEQHGLEAARLLQRMMDGEPIEPGTIVRVPPKGVVTRRSTDITAIPDARAAKALRYIWDNYMDNIGPDEVADACGMARRTLDRHFIDALGRTIAKEITRRRLKRACDLLAGSEMPAAEIAIAVGFRTPQYFNHQFKRHFKLPPQRYRETVIKKHKAPGLIEQQ